jgi:hypothetical protein
MLDRWKVKLSIRSDAQPKKEKTPGFWNRLWTETLGKIHGFEGKR